MIFLSYRRSDTAGHAGRIFDRLADRFGRDQVFMDVDTIQPGEDFAREIAHRIGSCDVLIALIGDQWLNATDSSGRRRVDDPTDFVRAEISAALERGIPVIPVLVEGARMPSSSDLPEPLRGLARHQALEVRDTRFDAEAEDLMRATARHVTDRGARGRGRRSTRRVALGLGGVVLLGAAWALWPVLVSPATPDITGRWIAEVADPGRDPFKVVLELEAMDGKVLGTVHYPTGSGGIRAGRMEGRRVTFETEHMPNFGTEPSTTRFEAELVGEELRGTFENETRARRFVARLSKP